MTDRSGEPETSEPGRTVVASDRFNKFEYPTGDFPYYNGVPVRISGLQWWFVIGMVVIGYLVLIAPVRAFAGGIGQFIPAILFPAIPLLGLAIVTPAHWTAIFRQVRGRDVLWMVVFALLNTVVTLAVGMVALKVLGVDRNPGLAGLSALSASELVLFYLKTAPHPRHYGLIDKPFEWRSFA